MLSVQLLRKYKFKTIETIDIANKSKSYSTLKLLFSLNLNARTQITVVS